MAKKSNRQELISTIMTKKYGSDDPKNDGKNRAFLESLSLRELEEMVEMLEFEESLGVIDLDDEDDDYYDDDYL